MNKALRRLFPDPGPVGEKRGSPGEDAGLAFWVRGPGLIVYYGEATGSFWAITPTGLLEAPDTDALLLAVWRYTAVSERVRATTFT
ncbi:hypothetical protein UIS43_24615 [Nocardiopsis sp. LDBS0036]|uniref:hypothetical protein n=1 Tax=Nocardiopsis sp. LDBS0036 TaxID=3104276 RepID=UPI0035184F2B